MTRHLTHGSTRGSQPPPPPRTAPLTTTSDQTSAHTKQLHKKKTRRLTDGRFSGGSHGFIIGHVAPEAQVGGPIALVQDGDPIQIDARPEARTIDLLISEEEWNRRRAEFVPPPLRASYGTLYKYIKNVATACEGCVTDEVNDEAEVASYGKYSPPHVPAGSPEAKLKSGVAKV